MAQPKLKPIEERDPYAAMVLDAFDRLQNDTAPQTGLALSIQQPWAWLIVNGYKRVENRTWATKVRGWFDVHAGQRFDAGGYEWVRLQLDIALPAPREFERGGIVGRANLADCIEANAANAGPRRFDPWFFGPYGFVLDGAEPLPFRACRGRLGFFRPEFATTDAESEHG